MIKFNRKDIDLVYYGKKEITTIYYGTRIVWEAIKSCFGKGMWLNIKPWINSEGWRNYPSGHNR